MADRIEIDLRNCTLTMAELIDEVKRRQVANPDRYYCMDGDAYAIVSREVERMTNPCEYGLRCPYRLNDECDAYCTYPKLAEDADEGEKYPDVRDTECDDVSPLLARILDAFAHDAEARLRICSILAEYETKEAELSRLDCLRTDEYGRDGE